MTNSIQKVVTKVLLLCLFSIPAFQLSAQLMKYEDPKQHLFEDGLKLLRQGDSLAAYQTIQAAHLLDPNDLDKSFYYQLLYLLKHQF